LAGGRAAFLVRLQEIIRASKVAIHLGEWHRGNVPRADFPIAKKAYGLGRSYEWRVIKFEALGIQCRVLVVLNSPKEKYEAILGVMADGRLRILCSYEYHAAEPGWHCHVSCGEVTQVPLGFMRGPWVRRVPRAKSTHKRLDFEVSDPDTATRFAIARYKIETRGSLL
jgi:hypothetical protein